MRFYAFTLVGSLVVVASARRRTTTTTETTTTTAEATTTADDEYMTTVKGLIDAGTCASVTTSNVCEVDNTGENLQTMSYYNSFQYGGYQVVVSSGVPDHKAETDATKPNPNLRCERWQYVTLPIRNDGETVDTSIQAGQGMGATGWAISGGVFYDHRSAPDGSTAWYNEGISLDSCNGHSTAFNEYHYHLNPVCISSAKDATICAQVGWLNDGYPVMGYCAVDGTTLKSCYTLNDGEVDSNHTQYTYAKTDSCHLDECNGYQFDWGYAYVMSEDYPYVPVCYNGDYTVDPCGF